MLSPRPLIRSSSSRVEMHRQYTDDLLITVGFNIMLARSCSNASGSGSSASTRVANCTLTRNTATTFPSKQSPPCSRPPPPPRSPHLRSKHGCGPNPGAKVNVRAWPHRQHGLDHTERAVLPAVRRRFHVPPPVVAAIEMLEALKRGGKHAHCARAQRQVHLGDLARSPQR